MAESGSAAPLFATTKAKCGIYVLEFEDGQRYVGQTVNIVSRYATHRRHHGDILGLRFAPCSASDLNALEMAIVQQEEKLAPLRNLSLTGLPAGTEDLEVSVSAGLSVILPWNREKRSRIRDEPKNSKERRFWKLRERDDYADLQTRLSAYIDETIPDPVDTQTLWSLTALPSTNANTDFPRLCTLSVGQLEVLYITEEMFDDGVRSPVLRFNLYDNGDLVQKLEAFKGKWPESTYYARPGYNVSYPIIQVTCESFEAAAEVLQLDFVLQAAYKLNVTLLRQGSRMFSRYHNTSFAADVLAKASERP